MFKWYTNSEKKLDSDSWMTQVWETQTLGGFEPKVLSFLIYSF